MTDTLDKALNAVADMETTNDERAQRAASALSFYVRNKGEQPDPLEYCEGDAVDLIADLFHLLNANGQDPENAVRLALMHYTAETKGE